jgi:hypothetical protein
MEDHDKQPLKWTVDPGIRIKQLRPMELKQAGHFADGMEDAFNQLAGK